MRAITVKKLAIPNDLKAARAAERQVIDEVRALGYDGEAVFAVKLALEEALANAVKHGNAGDPAKHILIEYAVNGQRVELIITDEGRGFRPDSIPDPTADENLECPSGRGIMLMRAYMDEVAYNRQGNVVRLVKRNT